MTRFAHAKMGMYVSTKTLWRQKQSMRKWSRSKQSKCRVENLPQTNSRGIEMNIANDAKTTLSSIWKQGPLCYMMVVKDINGHDCFIQVDEQDDFAFPVFAYPVVSDNLPNSVHKPLFGDLIASHDGLAEELLNIVKPKDKENKIPHKRVTELEVATKYAEDVRKDHKDIRQGITLW
jgi:hypothetical protein